MGSLWFIANVSRLFLSVCARRSPLGVEGCVGCADGGAVAAFEDEGGAQVRVCRVFAADFCDLFGSQVALGEQPQGDRAGHLGHVHAVCVGELARGFDPRAHDAAAVVLLVVLVVAIGEVVSINGERLVVGGSGGTSWEDGRSVDGDMCAVGEGDGVAGRAGGVRVGDLLACEQCVEVSGAFLGGVTVNDVEHGVSPVHHVVWLCFLVLPHCSMLWGCVHGVSLFCEGACWACFWSCWWRACGRSRSVIRCWGSETARAWGKHVEGRKLTNGLRPSPRVRPRVYPSAPGCLLVWEPDGCVDGGGFAVDDSAVAVFYGEAVACGASAVDAGVEGDGCGVVGCGGVEGDDGCFTAASPRGGGHVVVVACDGGVFCHGLRLVRVGGLFAGVLDAGAGDPCVGDGADGVAVWQGDGGGVAASLVGAWLVIEGCVYGDSVYVSRVGGVCLARVLAVEAALAVVVVVGLAWGEGEYAVRRVGNGFANQHVSERLLFALNPRVDLLLGERYADGGEWLALVAGGGEGAGSDVCVGGSDGGGRGFALVEEDERQAGDGARVVGVGVQVCALDDASVCVRAHDAPVVCDRVFARVAVCEGDGETGAVAQGNDVSVVALHVASVEELVEVGGELVCIAGGVGGGSRWRKAVFDVVPRVHLCVFLSVASRLFLFVSLWLRVFFARFPARHGTIGAVRA